MSQGTNEVSAKPIINRRVEITSIAWVADVYAAQIGVEPEHLRAFAEILVQRIKWDFIKATERGIQQAADILVDPGHDEHVRQRRKRERVREKERREESEVEALVRSADSISRLRSLRRERKMWGDIVARIDTDLAMLRQEWGDVIPPEAWREE